MKKKYFLRGIIMGITLTVIPMKANTMLNAGVTAEMMSALEEASFNGTAGVTKFLGVTLQNIREEELRLQKEKEKKAAEQRKAAKKKKKTVLTEEEKIRKYEEEMGFYHIYESPKGSFKSFLPWQRITYQPSMQWKLQNWAAYTDWNTGLREIDGRVCVALGSYYNAPIGAYVDLIMENGSVIKCIMADQKADEHTDPTHRWHSTDGSVGEFLVDKDALPEIVRQMGDISYIADKQVGDISQSKGFEKVYSFD